MNIKLSYSLISWWLAGDYEGVFKALNGDWGETSEAAQYGIDKHKEWEQEVRNTGCLPKVFGGEPLERWGTELTRELELTDWLKLKGRVDLCHFVDGEMHLVDFKTGRTPLATYANGIQHKIYKVLFPEAQVFDYMQFNQHTQEVDFQRVHLSPKMYEEAVDLIITVGCDIRATLENMGEQNGNA